MEQLKALTEKMKGREEHKVEYDAVTKIKRLTIVELEKLLNETIAPKDYIRLIFAQPEFGKQVVVGFTAQDSNTARQEYDSLSYRLGYLQGRLKAYETEEDLLTLVRPNKTSSSTP